MTQKLTQSDYKTIAEKILTESKSLFKLLDKLDSDLHTSDEELTPSQAREYAKKACGAGNNLRKKLAKIASIKLNEERNKYQLLKFEAEKNNEKFVSTVADKEASWWVKDLRLARNILESYVNSAQDIISICRMHVRSSDNSHEINANL